MTAPRGHTGRNKPFGLIERRIATRYLGAKKTQGGVGLIAGISFICIMLAIAAMIIIMSIMNGFRSEVIRLTIGSQGHMYVQVADTAISPEKINQIEQRLQSIEGVEEAFEFTQDFTGVQANGTFALGQVIGIRPDELRAFELISDNITQGSLDNFGTGFGSDHQIAVGQILATGLGLSVGNRITIYSPRTRATAFSHPQPIRKTYTIGAVFQTHLVDTDQTYIYMALDESTLLFKGGELSGEIQLRLDTPDNVERLDPAVRDAVQSPAFVSDWRSRNESLALALRNEQVVMRLIFMIVVIIAAFPVLSSMIMLVKNKSKDIAILKTIGVTSGGVLRIFLMSGAMIGILGTLMGLLIGTIFCLNIGVVQTSIEFVCQCELFPPEVYGLSGGIPVKMVWAEVIGVALWGFLISTAATFLPALSASRIDPVEALRYE